MGKLKNYIEKAARMAPGELVARVGRKVSDELYYSRRRRVAVKGRMCAKGRGKLEGYETDMKFMFEPSDRQRCVKSMEKLGKTQGVVRGADEICSHVFNLLGSGDRRLGEDLDWSEDFKTGFRWEEGFYRDIRIIDLENRADVKVVWELSRFQHMSQLGKAYWITGDEKYAKEFGDQILDWIEKNPFEMSVNWACAMDVAIRACNWILGYYFFRESEILDGGFWEGFNESLYMHASHIVRNLENTQRYNGNHYISNLAGLVWLGLYFRKAATGTRARRDDPKFWLERGIDGLEREILVQVNGDGTNYEASTSYHRLTAEIFLTTAILCCKNGIEFSIRYTQRLEKMCEFIRDITKPNGRAPLIGDADDGRFVMLSDYGCWEKDDFKGMLAMAGEFFERDDFRSLGIDSREEAVWTCGGYKEPEIREAGLSSVAYEDGGYYILRNGGIYCAVRCGQLSCRGLGGHSHNDQLSFELNVDGDDFIIDPGSYVYTADYRMRNRFRSTGVHNTLYFEGVEQNDFEEDELFVMKEQTFAKCFEFSDGKFGGRHFGYLDKCAVVHERNIEVSSDGISIKDRLIGEGAGSRPFACNFTLGHGVKARLEKEGVRLEKGDRRVVLRVQGKADLSIGEAELSKGYGMIESTGRVAVSVSKGSQIDMFISCSDL